MTKSLLWVIFSISLYTQKSYILININMVSNLEISPIYCPKLGVIYDQKNNTNFVKKMCIFSIKNKIITTSKAGLIGGRVCIVWNRVENEIILFWTSCSAISKKSIIFPTILYTHTLTALFRNKRFVLYKMFQYLKKFAIFYVEENPCATFRVTLLFSLWMPWPVWT